jgi:hypothetical protein
MRITSQLMTYDESKKDFLGPLIPVEAFKSTVGEGNYSVAWDMVKIRIGDREAILSRRELEQFVSAAKAANTY